MGKKIFKTLKKTNVVILKQPCKYLERNKKGEVTAVKQIQYVEGFNTIFVDEQKRIDPKVKPTPLYMHKGLMRIDEEDIKKIEFMEKCEFNVKNGGKLFKLLDVKQESMYQIDKFEKVDEAINNIMNADEKLIKTMTIWFLKPNLAKVKSAAELKILFRTKINSEALDTPDKDSFIKKINDFCNEKANNEKIVISVSLQENIIKIINGNEMQWYDNDQALYRSPEGQDLLKSFALYCKNTEDGRLILKTMAEKIKALNKVES